MSPDIPEQADPQRAIDAAQRELDAHDGNADGKIDHGAPQSDADREKLTAIYIGKVNDMQGRIADAKRTVEIGKNAQSPHWQELERACTEAETGLLEKLATVDPKTMHETVNAFDADVAQLLEKFSTVHPEQKEQTSVGMAEHARTLLTTLGLPSEAQNAMLDEAIAQYGEEGVIRAVRESVRDRSGRVQTQIDALNGNVITLMQRIVDETKGLQYGWRDNLKDLLRLSANMQTVGIASGAIDNVLPDRFSVADKGIQALVDEIKRVRPEIQTLSEQQQVIDGIAAALDITLAVGAADGARLAGRTEESDRRMTQLLEKYGTGLRGTDATRAMQSAMRLRDQKKLSPIEEAMLFDDPRSPQTLKKAIEQKLSESTAADVLDQVRAKQTFRAGSFEKFDKKNIYYNGRDVSGALGIGSKTILTYSNGRSMTVIATPQAQKVLESIPGDREPVLLRPVTSMVIGTQGVGRGMQSVLRCPPSECIIAHTDIGFVDGKGNIVRDDGVTPVDLGNSENRAMIEAQIQNQKGFHLERYQPKLPLRTAENKSYPNGLYTIKTQSGLSVEGVTVDRHAIDFVNAEPPEGQMLVLKRIPRPIVLRAPDSEQYGRGSRLYQRVLQTDIVSKEDLAYAKIDGDSLVTRDLPKKETDVSVSPPKEESTEVRKPVAEIEKEQEEKTRDIERVLDRNPAILGVKRSASTIQQTVGHFQKFLEAGQIGSARDSFVKFAREEARPTLEMLQDPRLKRDVEEAKVALRALKGVNGVALGGLEQKIDEQLKALDGFTAMLNDAGTIDLFKTITDESRFSADTWANFCMNELPVIVASITVACLLAAAVVLTMGGATPLIAVSASTFFLTSAGATALGTVAGAELGKEAVHAGHKYLDSRVRSGEATFTERSRFGKYAEGQKEIDEKTGTYRDRELFGDVLNPLAQEFSQAFIVTLGTMGIGNVVGGQLSKLLQNSKIVERLAARSDVMQSVVRRLSQLNGSKEALGKAANLKEAVARALKSLPKEIGEEFGDEAQEHVLETFLNQLDVSLAAADAVDGKLRLGTLTGVLLAIAKNTRIGKATISYDVRGKSPEALTARTQAIRTEAEASGAIVTDLGKGYLSIRHPVEADGVIQYETIQMQPNDAETAADSPEATAETMAAERGMSVPSTDTDATQPEDVQHAPHIESEAKPKTLDTQVQVIAARARENVPRLRSELEAETDQDKKAKGLKDLAKAEKIIANLEKVSVTLIDYQGIRDLGKTLKLPIQDQEVLARKVLENSDVNVNDIIKMDDTVGVARQLDQVTEARLAATSRQELASDASLESALPLLESAVDDPAPLAAMEWIVSEVKNPIEQTLLRELLADVRNIEITVLTDRERAIIFRESMEYLHDYEAAISAGGFKEGNSSSHDTFKLLQDNQRKLAHQTIVDRKFLTGSDHGVLHVIEADMRGAMKMADQLGGVLTPEAPVLLHQATIDHDMGYTLNTLDSTNNYFSQTKDHPLFSGIRTTDTWAQSLEQHFGPRVRDIYHPAVLDHSDVGKQPLQELVKEIRALDASDPQYQEKNLELQGKLVRKILALADCSGTTADIKMMKLFMEPELVGQIGQLKDLDDVRQPLKRN